MICVGDKYCPNCNGNLVYYDTVKRWVLHEYRRKQLLYLERFRCVKCRRIHRVLTNDIYPYKQYSRRIIKGFLSCEYTSEMLEFEDYPVAKTIMIWHSQ